VAVYDFGDDICSLIFFVIEIITDTLEIKKLRRTKNILL
jgi:hypothetical protein